MNSIDDECAISMIYLKSAISNMMMFCNDVLQHS
jgi:hypothetical protein